MTLNECVEKLNEMSVEDIKNLERYRAIAELCKNFSKVNRQEVLERVKQPSFQETAMPKEQIFMSIPRGCCKSLFCNLRLKEIDIEDREE